MFQEEDKVVYRELSYKITGFLFQAHKDLGRFRKEKQYGDYIEDLLKANKVDYQREYRIITQEKVRDIADFIIDNKIILELKAKDFIINEDYDQIKRYLITLNLKLGLLVNFRQTRVSVKRVLNSSYQA